MLENVIGFLLIVMGVFLVISVLMQSSKNHRVSGSIAGGAETFFGKQKGKQMDRIFNIATSVVTVIFVILVLVLYMLQPAPKTNEEIYQEMIDAGVIEVEDETSGTDVTEETETDVAETAEDGSVETESEEAPVDETEAEQPEAEAAEATPAE